MRPFRTCRACSKLCSQSSSIGTRRAIHSSAATAATPIPHPTAPGPPPPPPTKPLSQTGDRVERKKALAAKLAESRVFEPDAKKATGLKQRFWKDVSVNETPDGYQVMLDTRPVRDSQKRIITVPLSKPYLATALALEWDQLTSAQQATRQFYIPLTSLVSRAFDIRDADTAASASHGTPARSELRQNIVRSLLRYLSTDTLLCWAAAPLDADALDPNDQRSLRAQQEQHATPVIAYLTQRVWPGTRIEPVLDADTIVPRSQPPQTVDIIAGWLSGLPAFELAAVERGVLASKSLLAAVRLVVEWSVELRGQYAPESDAGLQYNHKDRALGDIGRVFGIEEAYELVTAEVRWQTQMWGEVEDTHDVEKEDLKRQLGSVILLVNGTSPSTK